MTPDLARLYWSWADASYGLRALALAEEVIGRRVTVDEAVERLVAMRRAQADRLREATRE